MQETRNNCFGSKNVARPFFRRKQLSTSAKMQQQRTLLLHFGTRCLPVFAWRKIMLHFFNPKQLLRVSCILWCYYPKCYSIVFVIASSHSVERIDFLLSSSLETFSGLRDCLIFYTSTARSSCLLKCKLSLFTAAS